MSDFLQSDIGESLSPNSKRSDKRKTRNAVFPNVSQLDPDMLCEMTLCIRQWLQLYAKGLSKLLRVPCVFQAIENQVVPHTQLPNANQVNHWAVLDGQQSHRILISFPREFSIAVCERVFGAPFEAAEDRALTDIEKRVMNDLCAEWLGLLRKVWEGLVIRPDLTVTDSDRQDTSITHWILFKTDVLCGEVAGEVRLYMSGATARRLLGQATLTRNLGEGSAGVKQILGSVPLEVQAVLGRTQFTFDELMSLSVGDIVSLDRRSYEPIEVVIDGRSAFNARASLSGHMVALNLISSSNQETPL